MIYTPAFIVRSADEATRLSIGGAPWTGSDRELASKAEAMIAKLFRFRLQFVRRQPIERKAGWLISRFDFAEVHQIARDALVSYHHHQRAELLTSFLDACAIPHAGGDIGLDPDEYTIPDNAFLADLIRDHIRQFGALDVAVYLRTAALIMGADWTRVGAVLEDVLASSSDGALVASEVDATEAVEPDEETPEYTEGLTTLDRVVIKTIVNAVSEAEGALTLDQVDEFIHELTHLSTDRHQTYFHRGFLNTLLGLPRVEGFESNETRRSWQLAGELAALARRGEYMEIVHRFDANQGEFAAMLRHPSASSSGGRDVFEALWTQGSRARAAQVLTPSLIRLRGPAFMSLLLDRAIEQIHGQQESDARRILELLTGAVDDSARHTLTPRFEVEVQRRLTQCLRADGSFQQAASEFQKLIERAPAEMLAELQTDKALCLGEFRRLGDVRVPAVLADIPQMAQRIRAGLAAYEEAVRSQGLRANGRYVLGVFALLEGRYADARAHLIEAYEAAAADKALLQRYRSSGVYGRILVAYALSIFQDYAEVHFSFATELLREADVHFARSEWPEWLLAKAVEVAAGFSGDGATLIEFVSEQFPAILEQSSHNVALLGRSDLLRTVIERNAASEARPRLQRWTDNLILLDFYRSAGRIEDAEGTLDRLEELAMVDAELRERFLELLNRPAKLDPLWDEEDILRSKVLMLQLSEQPDEASEVLCRLGHRFASLRRFDDAASVLDQLRSCGASDAYCSSLLQRLPAAAEPEIATASTPETEDPLRAYLSRHTLRVLFVGGGEKLERHAGRVAETLASRFGSELVLTFEHDSWSHNTGRTFVSLRGAIRSCDLVVLSDLMRTNLGRSLRKFVNEEGKMWGSCTSDGVDGMSRAIETVARRFVTLLAADGR